MIKLFKKVLKRIFFYPHHQVPVDGYTGLNKIDRKLLDEINPQRSGYFVELGANDGMQQSNTYKLQRSYGWSGLLIEPSPYKFHLCIKNRSFGTTPEFKCCACVDSDYPNKYVEMHYRDLMSIANDLDVSANNMIEHISRAEAHVEDPRLSYVFGAPARTLTSLLDEVKAPEFFDLLSIDVEGNELSVLKGLNFSKYKPKWILVEVRNKSLLISELLLENGYIMKSVLHQSDDYSDVLFVYRDLSL